MRHFYYSVSDPLPTRTALDVFDRGLHYGDGFFTTALVINNEVVNSSYHYQRLQNSALRLGFNDFDVSQVKAAAPELSGRRWLKIIVTRGRTDQRGYAPPSSCVPNVFWLSGSLETPAFQQESFLPICENPLSINPSLAGLKTLNALDRVLAQAEAQRLGAAEGVMQADGKIVCTTQSNLFFFNGDRIMTPKLDRCGVSGTTRAFLLDYCATKGIAVSEADIEPQDLATFESCCITNALKGVREVSQIAQFTYHSHSMITQFQQAFLTAVND